MKKKLYAMLAAAAFATAGSASASVVSSGGELLSTLLNRPFEVSVSATSQELFRGTRVGDSLVAASISTNWVIPGDGVLDVGLAFEDNSAADFETLFTAKATKAVADYDVSVGFNYYSEGTNVVGDITSELGLGVAKTVGPVDLSVTQFIAVDGDNDNYGEVGVGLSREVAGRVVDVKGTIGYVLDEAELTHAQVTLSTDLTVNPFDLKVTPFVTGVLALGNDVGGIYNGAKDEVIFGVKLSKSF